MADAPLPETTFDVFAAVDIRVGRVVEVEDFPEARRRPGSCAWTSARSSASGARRRRSASTRARSSRGAWCSAVVNFPPRQIGPVRSEVLVLGTYSADGVLLLSPEPDAAPGDRVG